MNYWIIPDIKDNVKIVNESKASDFINKVCWHYGLTINDIKSKSRKRNLVDARAIIGFVLYRNYNLSLHKIGDMINRDHSSIIHYNKKVDGLLKYDSGFRDKFEIINN